MKISPKTSVKKAPQSRGMSTMLRRLAARRVVQAMSAGTLLAYGAHSALAQSQSYTYEGQTPNTTAAPASGFFTAGFNDGTNDYQTPVNSTATIPTALFFGGSNAYTATDDIAALTINSLTFTNTLLTTIGTSAAGNILTLSTNGNPTFAPIINVGSGGAVIQAVLAGTNGFAKTGVGNLTLNTNTDQFTGNAVVTAGSLTVNAAQAATAGFILYNGTTLTNNQALANGNVILAATGTSNLTIATTTTLSSSFAGNGNLILTAPSGLTNFGTTTFNPLANFTGTLTLASNVGIRAFNGTSAGTFNAAFTNLDFANTSASINSRNGGVSFLFGGLQSTSTTALLSVGQATGGTAPNQTQSTGAATYIIGSANIASQTFAGKIANSTAIGGGTNSTTTYTAAALLTKVGTGTLILNNASTNTGTTTAAGGTLLLDFVNNPNGVLGTGTGVTALTFAGGTVSLLANTGAAQATTQSFGTTTVNAGGGRIVVNPNGGASTTLTLGSLTATAAGGSLNINTSAAGTTTITTTTGPTNLTGTSATYGGRITITDISGTNWATSVSGASPFVLSGYTNYTALNTTGGTTDTINSSQTDGATLGGSVTTNSLKITDTTAGNTLDIGNATNTLTLTDGGLLFTGPNNYTITDGNLASGTSATVPDLIISQFGAGNLTIGAVITNGAGTTGTLTKAGTGTLTLTGTNTYTGLTYLNNGVTSISSNGNLGAVATGAAVVLNSGTLQATASFTLDNAGANKRNINLGGGGGTIDVTGTNNLTVDGNITTFTGNLLGPLIKTNSGTLTLTGTNTYGGMTQVNGGTLAVNTTSGSGTGTGEVLVASSGTLTGTGTITGPLVVNGTINPGGVGAVAPFTTSTETYNTGSTVVFDFTTTTVDSLISTGSVIGLSNATFSFNALGGALTPGSTFNLLTATNDMSNGNTTGLPMSSTTPSGYQLQFANGGTQLQLAPAPEPSQFVAFGLGMLGLGGLALRARRRTVKGAPIT